LIFGLAKSFGEHMNRNFFAAAQKFLSLTVSVNLNTAMPVFLPKINFFTMGSTTSNDLKKLNMFSLPWSVPKKGRHVFKIFFVKDVQELRNYHKNHQPLEIFTG
jgi:hypothetical protein